MGVKLEPSPPRLPTLHCGSSPALPGLHLGLVHEDVSIFVKYLNAHLKFTVYGHKQASTYVNTLPQCSPVCVGLAQARPNLPSARLRVEGYSSCPVCLSVCLSVCPFSVFCLLTLLGVQREVSAATARKMQ